MKKAYLSTVFIFFIFLVHSQNNECNYKTKKDAFEKTTTYEIKNKILSSSLSTLVYDIYTVEKDENKNYFLMFTKNGEGQCLTENSYVSFLLSNEEVLTFKYKGSIKCGRNTISVKVTEDEVNTLIDNEIISIRLNIEYSVDYKINDKRINKFKENLKCMISI